MVEPPATTNHTTQIHSRDNTSQRVPSGLTLCIALETPSVTAVWQRLGTSYTNSTLRSWAA